jgi:sterol desaturase/sphingolipid hydroxylase (fatty acid hydroxylase superfamily)
MHTDNIIYGYSILAFVILSIIEALYLQHSLHEQKDKRDIICSLLLGGGGILSNFIMNGMILMLYSFLYTHRLFSFTIQSGWIWLLCFFGDDLSYYWFHRCSHEIRFLWASHTVHHSPEDYTLAGGLRIPWTGSMSGSFIFWAWMPLLGFNPAMVFTMQALSVIYQFWLHTELVKKLPTWFDTFFNTPYYHKIHHASDTLYLDKNHAGTLIIWDKMFGTFQKEIFPPHFGLTKKLRSQNPMVIAFDGWKDLLHDCRNAKSFKEVIYCLFKAPNWKPTRN